MTNGTAQDQALQNGGSPKLHNAMWPGLVGKGPDSEPPISLERMLELTAKARVGERRFDGVDLFMAEPHTPSGASRDELERLADKLGELDLVVGSCVAPVWEPVGGGSAMGSGEERRKFLARVRESCEAMATLRELGVRSYGVIRIDSAAGVADWAQDPAGNTRRIAETWRQAADIAEGFGERLAAEGEICWGGMHSWRHMLDLLEETGRPDTVGFQADMAHTLLYTLSPNAPEHALVDSAAALDDAAALDEAYGKVADALRPWTIDFHVAQNDATIKGSGSHDKTGKHCTADDADGKLDIARHAGLWLRGDDGEPTGAVRHICWDGCMFPNATLEDQATWDNILAAMVAVQEAHGRAGGSA